VDQQFFIGTQLQLGILGDKHVDDDIILEWILGR